MHFVERNTEQQCVSSAGVLCLVSLAFVSLPARPSCSSKVTHLNELNLMRRLHYSAGMTSMHDEHARL